MATLGKRSEHITTTDANNIMLTHFGEAWYPASSPPKYSLNTPVLYRPPEAVFAEAESKPITSAADIWSLGCTIYGLFSPGTLFEGFFPDEDDMIAEVVSALGISPQP
jgi:serine/threonine protein kinase